MLTLVSTILVLEDCFGVGGAKVELTPARIWLVAALTCQEGGGDKQNGLAVLDWDETSNKLKEEEDDWKLC